MRVRSILVGVAVVVASGSATISSNALAGGRGSLPAHLVYPSGNCPGTLQQCIDSVSRGDTVITGSTFDGNSGASGGAIGNLRSNLTVVNSTFVNNQALEQNGGAVRVGAAHYTTVEEIDRFLEAVAAL